MELIQDSLLALLRRSLASDAPDYAVFSIAVGQCEEALTASGGPRLSSVDEFQEQIARAGTEFKAYVAEIASSAPLTGAASPRDVVKHLVRQLARSVPKSFPRDAKHCQHVWSFVKWRMRGGRGGDCKMDCAGISLTVLCLCHALAAMDSRYGQLAAVRLQVSEDHCWLSLDGRPERSSAAEVATMAVDRQGEPPAADAWASWLYSGGHAVVCSPHQVLTAIVASMDTCQGDKGAQECWEARDLQCALLESIHAAKPAALYPAAAAILADLQQDVLIDAARARLGGAPDRMRQDVLKLTAQLLEPYQQLAASMRGGQLLSDTGGGTCSGKVADGRENGCAESVDDEAVPMPAPVAGTCGSSAPPVASDSAWRQVGEHVANLDAPGALTAQEDTTGCSGVGSKRRRAPGQLPDDVRPGRSPLDFEGGVDRAGHLPQADAPKSDGLSADAFVAQLRAAAVFEQPSDPGWTFYPYLFAAMYLMITAEFVAEEIVAGLEQQTAVLCARVLAHAGLKTLACSAAVLARYRCCSHDEQLHKKITRALEMMLEYFQWEQRLHAPAPLKSSISLTWLMRLVDGLSLYYAHKGVPAAVTATILKICRMHSSACRAQAALSCEWSTDALRGAVPLWQDLKPALRALLEAPHVPSSTPALDASRSRRPAR